MKRYRLILPILLIAVGFLAFAPLIPQFSAYDDTLNEIVFTGDAAPDNSFSLSYIHSVNKSKVTDYFQITEDFKIMVTKTSFFSYGAGIPEPEPGSKQVLTVYDDHIDIDNIDRVLNPYKFFVGVTANHTLTMNDTTLKTNTGEVIKINTPIPFTDYVSPQTSVTISIGKISFLAFIISKL